MRELISAYDSDARARLAVDVFCYRARKYLGATWRARRRRAVVFSGGIGENAPVVREKSARAWSGAACGWIRTRIIPSQSARKVLFLGCGRGIHVYVIPSDEEAIIARETTSLFQSAAGYTDKEEDAMANVYRKTKSPVLDAYWRAANYLSVGQIYLLDNPLLKEPLKPRISNRGCSATGARRRD